MERREDGKKRAGDSPMFAFVSLLKAGVTIPSGLASTIIPTIDNDPDHIPGSVFHEAIPIEIARIAANAYSGFERGDPIDRDDSREPLPRAVERGSPIA